MAAPFSILGIDHVVLRATDPVALERFYVDVLGCTVEKRQEAIALTQLRAGRALIDIIPAAQAGPAAGAQAGRGANMDHLCLRIEPFDAAAIRKHLAAQGLDCGEEKSRFGADGQGPSVYLTDPEGNGVELKGPPAAR
jgi:catechol 2,3-dioxygenase-like lactoylglutathione lyase family enzyme